MSDTDLWWSPIAGLLIKLDNGFLAFGGGRQNWYGAFPDEPFPEDAKRILLPECDRGPSSAVGVEPEIPWMAPPRVPRNRIAEREAQLTAELERLRQHLSASDGAEGEWHNLATKGVTASAKWKGRIDAALALIDEATSTGPYFLSPDETRAVVALLRGEQP